VRAEWVKGGEAGAPRARTLDALEHSATIRPQARALETLQSVSETPHARLIRTHQVGCHSIQSRLIAAPHTLSARNAFTQIDGQFATRRQPTTCDSTQTSGQRRDSASAIARPAITATIKSTASGWSPRRLAPLAALALGLPFLDDLGTG